MPSDVLPSSIATLSDLAAAVGDLVPRLVGPPVAVADLHHDSRTVEPGHGFVAIPGATADGHDFAPAAVDRGAVAVVGERLTAVAVPQLIVTDTRAALPRLAATVHHHPSRDLPVVGVTGTNGKTTVTYMLESIVRTAGGRPGLVGTVGARIDGRPVPLARTTPEATDLQRLLRTMTREGVDVAALEISSHALVLGRADEVRFAVVAFTNLSQDHLDFHGDLQSYAAAKASLFESRRAARAVIWADDSVGADIAASTDVPTTTVGFGTGVDVRGKIAEMSAAGSSMRIESVFGAAAFRLPLAGDFNVANALVAAGCGLELGYSLEAVAAGLEALTTIPGRFEIVDVGQPFTVVVDYAHTPDAIESALGAARAFATGRVIALAGAGGDRDRAKRPAMGAALAGADVTWITSDNPRSEDPQAIVSEVASGAGSAGELHIEVDRMRAIEAALAAARSGDVVLVLGKGHEQGQDAAGVILPFDDRDAAAAAIAGLREDR
ncbi:MAG: UDP-N-acetylmuramoyl-L-alanyl-D-glutamate--2,6-diaminopimelate ligase [Acidimicrobiia bacterium]